MDQSASARRLLNLLLTHWHERPHRWALDGSISSSGQEALHKDAPPPLLTEPAIWLVARSFAPDHANNWFTDAARRVCDLAWSADRGHGLSEP